MQRKSNYKKPYKKSYKQSHKPKFIVGYMPNTIKSQPGKWYIFSEHIDYDEGRYCQSSIEKGPFDTAEEARKLCKNEYFEFPFNPCIMEEKFSKFVGKLLEGKKIQLQSGELRDFNP